jgi:RNA polymerase sigma-70 factor (ECF subfamily)
MRPPSDSRTSPTLLGRLHRNPADPTAWDEFVGRYGRKIYLWCRGWGLQDADAEDVTQNILLEIARKMRTFTYDPSRAFRGWLRALAHAAWCDFLDSRPARERGSGDSGVLDLLHSVAQPDGLARQLEELYDLELLEEATVRVRLRVEPRTWDAFRLLAYEERSGADVAAELGMKVTAVYLAKSRVQRMLQDEIRALEAGAEAPS